VSSVEGTWGMASVMMLIGRVSSSSNLKPPVSARCRRPEKMSQPAPIAQATI
jgi:hypothetical protein